MLLCWLFAILSVCDAYKILVVFPVPGKSHSILGEGYVTHLLNAGHEVTYITPLPVKNPPKKLHQIEVSELFKLFPQENLLDLNKLMKGDTGMQDKKIMVNMFYNFANGALNHEKVQALLHDPKEEFDAVIVEWMFSELYSGFGYVFGCPLIWSTSTEPHHMVLSLMDEAPNTAYVPDLLSGLTSPLSFSQRVGELWDLLYTKYVKWTVKSRDVETYNKAYGPAAAIRGRTLPPYDVAKYNASLMLGNSHVSAGEAIRLPQSYKPILGYHIDREVKPLPDELQKVMDSAKHGVIYFSMGSMLKSSSMPMKLKTELLNMFGTLKETVIWKFEEELPNVPKNVHMVTWAPQQSILAHPNCKIFITHGGLLSTTETLHYGVPIIGIPMFGDQFGNVNKAVTKGYAKKVNLSMNTPAELNAAIEEMLTSPRYKQVVSELSFVYHHRPVPPGTELVHWVEHVIRTRGAPHLRSPALMVPWYQKMYLDLVALILGVLLTFIFIVLKVLFTSSASNSLSNKKIN